MSPLFTPEELGIQKQEKIYLRHRDDVRDYVNAMELGFLMASRESAYVTTVFNNYCLVIDELINYTKDGMLLTHFLLNVKSDYGLRPYKTMEYLRALELKGVLTYKFHETKTDKNGSPLKIILLMSLECVKNNHYELLK